VFVVKRGYVMRDGEVDEIDRKILSILLDDGRKSFNEISLMVGVSTGTVANRVRKLIERGVIKRFTVELDWRKLGFDVFAIILIEAEIGKVKDVSEELYSYPEVGEVYTGIGGTPHIVAFVRASEVNDLFSFMQNKVAVLEGIKSVRSVIVGESRKNKSSLDYSF